MTHSNFNQKDHVMIKAPKKLAILVGGGPAPGINSVISAATIRAILEGVEVVGIKDGFKWIMRGDIDHTKRLTIDNVSRIHFRGGRISASPGTIPPKTTSIWKTPSPPCCG